MITLVSSVLLAILPAAPTVHVGSKSFAESYLLAEIFAQAIEARGLSVKRDFGLGGSQVAFDALGSGSLDVYPEYDGTALLVLLAEPLDPPGGGPRRIRERVAQGMAERGLIWLAALGFSNDWVLAVPNELAGREGLTSISDLAEASSRGVSFSGGFSAEFLGRQDGLTALELAYGFTLGEARPMSEPLKYSAIAEGKINLVDASSTDAHLERLHLTGLADDHHFFPSYDCAPLARADLALRAPAAVAALLALADRLDQRTMLRLNALVGEGASASEVARGFLRPGAAGDEAARAPDLRPGVQPKRPGLVAYLRQQRGYLARLLVRHLELTFAALLAATALGLALGFLASRRRLSEAVILKTLGVFQTIPALPLLAFLVPWLGIGAWPSLVALFLYALLPIAQATHAGLTSIDPDLIWIAQGQGMTEHQISRWIRFPLASVVAFSGIRVAAVTTVGNATLAAFVGGGGLGEPILTGLTLNDHRLLLLGAVPAAILALAMDGALAFLSRRLAPSR